MSFLRNRVFRRLSILGRIADLALIAGLGLRFAQRKGLVDGERLAQFGLGEVGDGEPLGVAEIAMAAAAAARLFRRRKR